MGALQIFLLHHQQQPSPLAVQVPNAETTDTPVLRSVRLETFTKTTSLTPATILEHQVRIAQLTQQPHYKAIVVETRHAATVRA